MKLFLMIIISLFLQSNSFANKIDELEKDIDVENFIRKNNKKMKLFNVLPLEKIYSGKENRKIADSLHIKTWQKVDFDSNGLTDLVVYGIWDGHHYLLVIIDKGKKLAYYPLNKGFFQEIIFPKVEIINNTPNLILTEQTYSDNFDDQKILKITSLIYKFDQFIEPNLNPKQYKIEKIEYSTTECYGTCPVFKIEINSDRRAIYNAIKYNNAEGKFYSKIDAEKFRSLIELLNYTDFPNLENRYKVNWTDDQSCTLTITYDNDKKKIISDYGKIGTNGLKEVYNRLFDLRENQYWSEN